jgi:hypothetical protein
VRWRARKRNIFSSGRVYQHEASLRRFRIEKPASRKWDSEPAADLAVTGSTRSPARRDER